MLRILLSAAPPVDEASGQVRLHNSVNLVFSQHHPSFKRIVLFRRFSPNTAVEQWLLLVLSFGFSEETPVLQHRR